MELKFKRLDDSPLPTKEVLKQREKEWGVRLPEDYKQFMMEHGGCEVEPDTFRCKENGQAYGINFIARIRDDEHDKYDGEIFGVNALMDENEEYLIEDEDETYPPALLPIARLFGEHLVCMDFRDDGKFKGIYVWDSVDSEKYDPVVYKVADTFTEFLGMLYEYDPNTAAEESPKETEQPVLKEDKPSPPKPVDPELGKKREESVKKYGYEFIKGMKEGYRDLTEEDFTIAEKRLSIFRNIKLPEELKNFYLKFNGLEIYPSIIDASKIEASGPFAEFYKEKFSIDSFISIKYGNDCMETQMENGLKEDELHPWTLPFAKDKSGHMVYMYDLDDGSIYGIYRRQIGDGEWAVAPSLDQFLKHLKIRDSDEFGIVESLEDEYERKQQKKRKKRRKEEADYDDED